jgi:hypothetical protein
MNFSYRERMKKFRILSIPFCAWFLPYLVSAGEAEDRAREASQEFIGRLEVNLIFPLVTLMLGIAFAVFMFGVFEYIKGAGSDSERAQGQRHMLYGVIGVVIMLSAIAILRIAAGTFGLTVTV